MRARVRAADGAHVRLELTLPRAEQRPPADLLLAAGSADFPFDLLESSGDRVVLARRGSREPAIVAGPEGCLFALEEGWRKALSLLLLQRLMRCREDAIFFHAGSVALGGRGRAAGGPQGRGQVHAGAGAGRARPRPAGRRARLLSARHGRAAALPAAGRASSPARASSAVEGALRAPGTVARAGRHDAGRRWRTLLAAPPAAAAAAARGRLPGRVRGGAAAARPGARARGPGPACSRWARSHGERAAHAARLRDGAAAVARRASTSSTAGRAGRDGGHRWRRRCGRHEPRRRRSARGASATFRFLEVRLMETAAAWTPDHARDGGEGDVRPPHLGLRAARRRAGQAHVRAAPAAPALAAAGGAVRGAARRGAGPWTATAARLAALYDVLLPGVQRRYEAYRAEVDPVLDAPSLVIVERILRRPAPAARARPTSCGASWACPPRRPQPLAAREGALPLLARAPAP